MSGVVAPAASQMRGRYLVRNRALNAALRVSDVALALVVRSRPTAPGSIRRVLFAIGGHLGDAVIATAAIAELRRRLPDVEVGVVVPSWVLPVFTGHPDVRWTHTVDHWRVDRSGRSPIGKLVRYATTSRAALESVRQVDYDLAIDLSPFFPNMAWLLWRAGIPARIGYESGGAGPLYTRAAPWLENGAHMAVKQQRLVDLALGETGAVRETDRLHSVLPPLSPHDRRAVRDKLASVGIADGDDYVVLHAGSGERAKEWPIEKWKALAADLVARGTRVVLTGAGTAETDVARSLATNIPELANLAGELSWPEFVGLLNRARLVISADTVAAHVASAVDTPCVTLFSGINDLREWRPMGSLAVPLINPVPCAPCFRNRGCDTMLCVRGISPERVANEALTLLNARA